jgi:cytochrome c-type biogenesis protein CcmH/NrfG
MLLFGTIAAALYATVALVAWLLLRTRRVPIGVAIAIIAPALWVCGVSVMWFVQHEDAPRARSELVRSLDSLAYPVTAESAPPAAVTAPTTAGMQAGSVESLVVGLEARLAAQPNDANGWALLAQSYAYTANEEAGERAIRRAVELGFDEQSLRERVAAAKRSVHAGDGVDRSSGAAR